MLNMYYKNNIVSKRYLILRVLVAVIILLPVISWAGCKKQAKCGCGKDVVSKVDSMLLDHSTVVYGSDGSTAYFQLGYNTYYFCNPTEMYSKYKSMRNDDQMLLSGDLFWECSWLMNSSNSYYSQYYKVYNIQVTLMEPYLYGKK
jgi:hypothetical protein